MCLDRPRSVRFACGHLVSCDKCAVSLQRCPFCRQIVVDKHGFLIPFKPAESSNEEESEDEEELPINIESVGSSQGSGVGENVPEGEAGAGEVPDQVVMDNGCKA